MIPVIPESAPFTPAQRAWLNGFFAGLLGLDQSVAPQLAPQAQLPAMNSGAAVQEEEEDFPWHDPALNLDERMQLAQGKPLRRMLMAAMGQLDCGQCGYLCQSYAEAIAQGADKDLSKCVPGGKATAKKLKQVLAQQPAASEIIVVQKAAQSAPAASGFNRENPYLAALINSAALNQPAAEKQTQHVALHLDGSDVRYEPGDSLGVFAKNWPLEVETILDLLGASGDAAVIAPDGRTLTAGEALLGACSLREPGEEFFRLLSRCAKDETEAARLKQLADDDPGAEVSGLYDVIDVLKTFASARPGVVDLVAALPKLQPRLYSIASSLKAHPGEVHLTVAVVRYQINGRARKGVASAYFAERLNPDGKVPVYIHPAHDFRLPENPDAPIIMVGPGTGIAPFRAFLEEREAQGATGKNWLLFGNQRSELDFLYQSEFETDLREGLLTRLDTAFSRDQANKVYVQHRMLENARELWQWLEAGAHFYVCGDAKRMASDVDKALHQVVAERGGMDAARAKKYVADLVKAKRYLRDVY